MRRISLRPENKTRHTFGDEERHKQIIMTENLVVLLAVTYDENISDLGGV